MKSIASAPGKIILFGEHFVVHGTKAILAAVNKRVTVTSTITNNQTLKINSQLGTIEIPMYSDKEDDYVTPNLFMLTRGLFGGFTPKSFSEHPAYPSIKSELRPFVYLAAKLSYFTISESQDVRHGAEKMLLHPDGLEITIDSDIPIGVGLGSSSACCVAAAASISELFKKLSSEKILNLSIEAEKTIFPDTSGADCTVCTYGGMIEYPSVEKIDNTFDLNLLIVNSMIQHSTKRSVEKVRKFKENNEKRFSELCDLVNQLMEHYDKLGRRIGVLEDMIKNDITAIGLKMSENQKYLEEIQVSNDTLRDMISSLKEISLGTKITGAGDGGCIIALVKDENLDKVPALLGKDKECFSAKIDTKGVVWSKIEE